MPLPQRILVGVDFSEPSLMALEYGVALLGRAGCSLVVVHVLDRRRGSQPASPTGSSRLRAVERLASVARELGLAADARARLLVCSGEPCDIVCSAAIEARSTLILVGASGVGAAKGHGSVTRRLLESAPCPVVPIGGNARGVLPHVTGCPV